MAIAKKNSACRLSTVVFVGFLRTVCPYRSEDEVDNLLTAMDTESTEENVTQGASEFAQDSNKEPGDPEEVAKLVEMAGQTCTASGLQKTCYFTMLVPYRNSRCLNKKCYCSLMYYYDKGDDACKRCCKGSTSNDFSFGTSGHGANALADWNGCETGYEATASGENEKGDKCVNNEGQGPSTPDTGRDCLLAETHTASLSSDRMVAALGGNGGKELASVSEFGALPACP